MSCWDSHETQEKFMRVRAGRSTEALPRRWDPEEDVKRQKRRKMTFHKIKQNKTRQNKIKQNKIQ